MNPADSGIVIAGGSGFIGRRLTAELAAAGYAVTILTRAPTADVGAVRFVRWTPDQPGDWTQALEGARAVINLCGEPVVGPRWTDLRKQLLVDSRVTPTESLVRAVQAARQPPGRFLQASGVGAYGIGEGPFTESARIGNDFLANLTRAWEKPLAALDLPHPILRLGVVLGKRGGALPQMLLPFRMFVGGPIASGNQWLPWIHLHDAVAACMHLIEAPRVSAVYNLCAPNPVRNHGFAEAVGQALRRPTVFPLPRTVMHMLLGEQATVLCDGQQAVPAALLREGFEFRYPTIEQALRDLTG